MRAKWSGSDGAEGGGDGPWLGRLLPPCLVMGEPCGEEEVRRRKDVVRMMRMSGGGEEGEGGG